MNRIARKYADPQKCVYEINGELYTFKQVAEITEQYQHMTKLKYNIFTALTGIHITGFLLAILLVDAVSIWPLMLIAAVGCLVGAIYWGLKAGEVEKEI